ncbi:sorting nexin Mvp1 [Coccidioides immitis RS]|uniref:Sorting nexin MVP1 n=1 Tax=Coccidioides immitis (strain RS) TaxID=246410 RepID=A0A0D8JW72_COCIM|nr:sorting nexin Mvp1 [Coccidioides immitis RS]KJF61374.1 sorting nexin Mvp1 [Coccidioides immitis RS]TPX20849.1 Sorting nexin mvp1 [Coccidioides immitis]
MSSLFGTPSDESPMAGKPSSFKSKSPLFDNEPSSFGAKSSALFADNVNSHADDSSPWGMPTPKKAARHEVLKSLLPATDVPESYVDVYDVALGSSDNRGNTGVGITTARKMLTSTHLNPDAQSKVMNIVAGGGDLATGSLSRSQFNVFLALVGLAQEGEDVTLDAVDERRKRLPRPNIPYIEKLTAQHDTNGATHTDNQPIPTQSNTSRQMRQDSFEDPELDPWGSHRIRQNSYENRHRLNINGFASSTGPGVNGTTNNLATAYNSQVRSTADSNQPRESGAPSSGGTGAGWGGESFSNPSGGGFGNQGESGFAGGFGQSGDDQGNHNRNNSMPRSLGGGPISNNGVDEVIAIHMLPEKEGMFMFQHRNYEVKSARRGSSVIRRYSDFVWLVDCLQKRYPFRQIPLLPPKRIAVNGTHLTADSNAFLEKRRRGLVRFTNALVRHPVLNQEQLVVMFLTVPTELSIWRKQATISVQEEFSGKPLPPDLEDSLPPTLNDLFETVRSGVRRSSEVYINLCNLLDRLAKRNQGLAVEQFRFSRALQALTDSTADTYAVDRNDVPLLNDGIHSTAKHLITSQGLLEDEARAWDEGVLEDFKRQRDCLVAMRDMFDRKDRYAKDNILQLEKRIENNERKLQELRARPEGTVRAEDAKKLEDAIFKDKASIVQQHARGVLIKECVRDELYIFQRSQYHISRLHQDWSQERVKYAELQADNWRALCEEVEAMPTGD